MINTKLRKTYACCALAMALTMTAGSISVFAADPTPSSTEVNTVAPDDADKASDPANRTGLDPTDTANYSNTDIDVWGYTKNTTVYSVDVEWGAMTFEYEASKWDPVNHKNLGPTDENGAAGWRIYDSTNNTVVEGAQNAINKITVTNHSNAQVYAKLSYASETAYAGTTGTFAGTDTASEDVKATWTETDATNHSTGYLTLKTAATDASDAAVAVGAEGVASVGNVYFTPKDIAADTTIDNWTKIGKITVALQTTDPTAPAP